MFGRRPISKSMQISQKKNRNHRKSRKSVCLKRVLNFERIANWAMSFKSCQMALHGKGLLGLKLEIRKNFNANSIAVEKIYATKHLKRCWVFANLCLDRMSVQKRKEDDDCFYYFENWSSILNWELCAQIHLDSSSHYCVHIFCFFFLEEKIWGCCKTQHYTSTSLWKETSKDKTFDRSSFYTSSPPYVHVSVRRARSSESSTNPLTQADRIN